MNETPGLLISMVLIDVDLFEPTEKILTQCLSRMPKGGVVAFDELSEPSFPGETIALLENFQLNSLKMKRSTLQGNCGYFVVGD